MESGRRSGIVALEQLNSPQDFLQIEIFSLARDVFDLSVTIRCEEKFLTFDRHCALCLKVNLLLVQFQVTLKPSTSNCFTRPAQEN